MAAELSDVHGAREQNMYAIYGLGQKWLLN